MTEPKKDPLQRLISDDAASLDRERIANFLESYISFDEETKEIIFSSQFIALKDNVKKIEIVLLASKVRSLIFSEEEGYLPKEIIALEFIPEGSVKGTIKKLFDSQKIKKYKSGRYHLPNYRVNDVIKKLIN